MVNTVKILLAILLFGCLIDMPYGYYQFVRFSAMAGFVYIAFFNFENERKNEALIYVVLALLFQPFFKIALGRELWNIVDVIIAIYLFFSAFSNKETEQSV